MVLDHRTQMGIGEANRLLNFFRRHGIGSACPAFFGFGALYRFALVDGPLRIYGVFELKLVSGFRLEAVS